MVLASSFPGAERWRASVPFCPFEGSQRKEGRKEATKHIVSSFHREPKGARTGKELRTGPRLVLTPFLVVHHRAPHTLVVLHPSCGGWAAAEGAGALRHFMRPPWPVPCRPCVLPSRASILWYSDAVRPSRLRAGWARRQPRDLLPIGSPTRLLPVGTRHPYGPRRTWRCREAVTGSRGPAQVYRTMQPGTVYRLFQQTCGQIVRGPITSGRGSFAPGPAESPVRPLHPPATRAGRLTRFYGQTLPQFASTMLTRAWSALRPAPRLP